VLLSEKCTAENNNYELWSDLLLFGPDFTENASFSARFIPETSNSDPKTGIST
jgi:hypothetical protein